MKNLFCLMFIVFTYQAWSQVKTGVYKSEMILEYQWEDGVQVGDTYQYRDPLLLHITENGYRVFKKEGDTGNSFPLIYIGQDADEYHVYAVPFGDRFEINDSMAVLFYNFDDTTGWYQSSIEYRSLRFLYEKPLLE